MKFTCYKNDLLEAMQILIYSVAVKPMTPILAGIYLNVTEDGLEMQANNFTTRTILRFPVTVAAPGKVVVSGKKFQDFVRNMPEETITLFGEDAAPTFSLESGSAHVDLLTMPVGDFPEVKEYETYASFKIRSIALKNMIRKTVFAVAKDNDRPIFKGCCFEVKGHRLNVIATNAQRIAFATEEIQSGDPNDHANFVVPTEILRCLMQSFDENDVDNFVEVKYSDRVATFEFNNVYMNTRLIEGEFPAYDKAFETHYTTTVELEKAELRQAVDLIALTARDAEYNAIKFNVVPGQINISSSSPDVGDARKIVEADLFGNVLDIAFNVDYIIDVLRVLDTSRICIKFGGRYDPVLFCEDKNENYSYILTPVRI